ncbi:FxsA family protein [Salinibacillus xinjiangensis]|uniref:Membrane protein FxsA n=1 Tax=Salinibacillus xinjiangensis TaxID=1229268 RepID=A0A6G1X9R3_9BACI|nr:FxsA family protein [Salinibacillus xinjiangensis]MRG87682.1 membrane protein FxsA [Salinibacillus xinjiangensis]
MFRFVFLFIVIMSALEIGVFMWIGDVFSVMFVVLGIIITGVIGAFLAKQQGLDTLNRARNQLGYGRFPHEEIFDGLAILIGAVLLFTPGFITDTIAFILLFPVTRFPIKRWMKTLVRKMLDNGTITIFGRWR